MAIPKTGDRFFIEQVCEQYGQDIARFVDMRLDPMDGSVRVSFRAIPMPRELGAAMRELKTLIDDDMRGAVLLASAPDTYHKINKALIAFGHAGDQFWINLDYREVERLRHASISRPPSYRT